MKAFATARSMARPLKEGRSVQERLPNLKRQSSLLDGIIASMENWHHWIAKATEKERKVKEARKEKCQETL